MNLVVEFLTHVSKLWFVKNHQDEVFAEDDLENTCSWREHPENNKRNVGVHAYEKAPRAKHNNGAQKKLRALKP